MLRTIRRRATYANVVATLALVVALGSGSAYALQGRNTVFSDDIVPDAVKGKDTLEASLKIPRIVAEETSNLSQGSDEAMTAAAQCPTGYSVTGGGFTRSNGAQIRTSGPGTFATNRDLWLATAVSSAAGQYVTSFAVCERGRTKYPG